MSLAVPVGLTEIVIWRSLQAKWAGERDSLWPWSDRTRRALQQGMAVCALIAAGSWKAHYIQQGTSPAAVLFSAVFFGGLFALALIAEAVEKHRKRLS